MPKQPSPHADQLRALREAAYDKAQAAQKAWGDAEAKAAKRKPKKPKET